MKKLSIKNKFQKVLSFCLAVFMLVSTTACNVFNSDGFNGGSTVVYDGTEGTGLSSGGIKNTNTSKVEQTNQIMVQNGKTEYKIVLPATPASWDNTACDELTGFLKQSSGVNFTVISDEELAFDKNEKYISLGRTTLFSQSGLVADEEELGVSGYIIKTIGNSIFICGGKSKGTLYGVYEFLNHTVGYEFYAEDEIAIDNLSKVYLFDFDVKTIPSFEYSYLVSSAWAGEPNTTNRYRITMPWILPNAGAHSSFVFINKDKYNNPNKQETYHPEYYAHDVSGQMLNQLCYSADGLVDTMVAEMIPYLEQSYVSEISNREEGYIFVFGQEDYWGWCRCSNCKAEYEKYGTDAAVLFKFINQVAEKIEIWGNENQPGREIKICTFAYMDTEKPPVKYDGDGNLVRDENGKPIPIDDSVRCRDNVIVRLAPIDANWYESFAADSNKYTQNVLEGWKALGECIVWLYSIGFSSYYAQFNNFNSLQATYQYVKEELGCLVCEDEYLSKGKGNPCFVDYRMYLQTQLMWNVYADQEQLTKNFFKNYYRDAADIMLKYLEELRLVYMDNWAEVGLLGDCNSVDLYLPGLWSRGTLLNWVSEFEKAKDSVAHYKNSNVELYDKLISRITMESLSVRYLLIRLYGDVVYTPRELYDEKVEFYNEVLKYDMWPKNARYTFEDLKRELGI